MIIYLKPWAPPAFPLLLQSSALSSGKLMKKQLYAQSSSWNWSIRIAACDSHQGIPEASSCLVCGRNIVPSLWGNHVNYLPSQPGIVIFLVFKMFIGFSKQTHTKLNWPCCIFVQSIFPPSRRSFCKHRSSLKERTKAMGKYSLVP